MLFFTALESYRGDSDLCSRSTAQLGTEQVQDSRQMCKYLVWVWCPGTFFLEVNKEEEWQEDFEEEEPSVLSGQTPFSEEWAHTAVCRTVRVSCPGVRWTVAEASPALRKRAL